MTMRMYCINCGSPLIGSDPDHIPFSFHPCACGVTTTLQPAAARAMRKVGTSAILITLPAAHPPVIKRYDDPQPFTDIRPAGINWMLVMLAISVIAAIGVWGYRR